MIVAMPTVQTSVSEKAWEEDIVSAVSAAVYADKTIDTLAVRQLEYEDCQWVFEGGMPMPDYGVTVFENGRGIPAWNCIAGNTKPAVRTCSRSLTTWRRRGW